MSGVFPPPGGSSVAVLELAPEGDEFHEFVRAVMAPWADPDVPGMHRTATIARLLAVTIGAHNELEGGRPVSPQG